jgi:hypothetical protein
MQAARLAGVSKTTVRRAQEDGELAPHPGPNGEHLVDEAELRLWLLTRQRRERSRRAATTDTGAVAALAFERFDQNENPVDVVKAHQLDPDLVERLHAQWSRLRGTLTLSGDQLAEIVHEMVQVFAAAAPAKPLRTSADFRLWTARVAEQAHKLLVASSQPCSRCKKGNRTTCSACVNDTRLEQRLRIEQVRAAARMNEANARYYDGLLRDDARASRGRTRSASGNQSSPPAATDGSQSARQAVPASWFDGIDEETIARKGRWEEKGRPK